MEFWEIFAFGVTCILSGCAFFLFLIFLNKLIQAKKMSRELLPLLGLTILFLMASIGYMAANWGDYFRWEFGGLIIIELYQINIILTLGSLAMVNFICEYILKKTRYLITIYIIVCSVILALIRDFGLLNFWLGIFTVPIFFLCPFIFHQTFIKETSGYLRRRMNLALIGFVTVGIGVFGRSSFLSDMFGLSIFSIGTIIAIAGATLLAYGFDALSSFTDINWKLKMRELLVIHRTGVCLHAYSFDQEQLIEDSDLIAGGFSGIQAILSEMVQTSESMQLIDYEDIKILLEQRADLTFVLIIKEESSFLRYKLKLFSEEFHQFFREALEGWSGRVDVFVPARTLTQRIFEVNV